MVESRTKLARVASLLNTISGCIFLGLAFWSSRVEWIRGMYLFSGAMFLAAGMSQMRERRKHDA